jgi:hypothetical protein
VGVAAIFSSGTPQKDLMVGVRGERYTCRNVAENPDKITGTRDWLDCINFS